MSRHEDCRVPQIRFSGYVEDWEEKTIGAILSEEKRQIVLEDNKQYELITVKRRNEGIVSRGHLFGRNILVKNYSQLKAGDFVVSKRQVVHGATGMVPRPLNNAIVSNEYLVATSSKDISTEFLTILSSLPEMKRKFFLSSYGVDIEKLFFDANDWKKRTVRIPDKVEQDKICAHFKELDQLIQLDQRKHEKLVMLKQAMLQKMFPQPSANAPEIRFKGFSKNWELKILGDIGNAYSGLSGKKKEDFGHGDAKYVTYMGVFSNAVCDENSTALIEIDARQNQVNFGDVLFTTSSETPEEVGLASVWMGRAENTYLNSFCFGFRPSKKIDPYFLAYSLRAPYFRKSIVFLGQGISRYNISKRRTMNLSVCLPDYSEQQKIGHYFRQLDELISRHATQLEKLKQVKAACLEKMFV